MIEPASHAPRYWNHRVGVHLVADLRECALGSFAPTEASLVDVRAEVSRILAAHRFTELGSYFHFFGPGAVTATVCLAESHLSFHSWPEERYVSFDLFACASTATAVASNGAASYGTPLMGPAAANRGSSLVTSPVSRTAAASPHAHSILERCEQRVRAVFEELSSSMFRPGSITIQALYR